MTAGTSELAVDPRRRGVTSFLIKCFLLGVAIVGSGFVIRSFDSRAPDESYLAAILEKDRLLRSTPSPKLILVGGSNLAFGIDSRMMHDSLNVNVVNMGLYAKLGLRYMLAQVKPYIRAGDVVVIVPEYDQFYGKYAEGDYTLNTALLYAPADRIADFIKSYSFVDVVLRPRVEDTRRAFLHVAAAAFKSEDKYVPHYVDSVYSRYSFNQYGDMTAHLGRRSFPPDSIYVGKLPPAKDFSRAPLDEINDIGDVARSRRAQAYFLFPSYMDRAYNANAAEIAALEQRLAKGMRIPILGGPRDFTFPASWFFDTRFHLNERGRGPRTVKMIEIMRAARARDGW